MTSSQSSQNHSFWSSLKAIVRPALAFVAVGLLLGLRIAAQAMIPHIFQPGDYVTYQNVVDGLPVPRPLAWNPELIDFLAALHDLSGVTLPLAILFVFGPLWLVMVRRVNSTFRLVGHAPSPAAPVTTQTTNKTNTAEQSDSSSEPITTNESHTTPEFQPPPEGQSPTVSDQPPATKDEPPATSHQSPITNIQPPISALSTPLEFYGLIKALTLLVAMGLPLGAIWILVDWEDTGSGASQMSAGASSGILVGSIWALRLALLGLAFWTGFHRDGLAGDFTHSEWNSSRRRLPSLALRGACFGLAAYAACRIGLPQHLEDALIRLQTLGGFNILTWREITRHILLSYGLVWLALGCLFAFLTPPPNQRFSRLVLLLPLGACLLSGLYQRRLSPQSLAARYDIRPEVMQAIPENLAYRPDVSASGVPEGIEAARELARELRLPFDPPANPPGRGVVLFMRRQTAQVFQNNLTLDGFTPDANLVTQTNKFLQSREYQSALSWIAFKNLFNVPLLRFDTTGAIRISIEDLTHYPHNAQFAPTLAQMLAVCAATPENEALLNQWADELKFAFPDRESRRMVGDIYRRFGNIKQALVWYRKADMPASFLQRVTVEKPMFRAGTIHGVLRWNGKPLVGAQVAVVPALMNGLPAGMEAPVAEAMRNILSEFPRENPDLFPAYHPAPWQFRFVSASATTDSRGAYRIDHLTEGTYHVLCTLPDGIRTNLPFDTRLHITHPLHTFNLRYEETGYDMGTTEFLYK